MSMIQGKSSAASKSKKISVSYSKSQKAPSLKSKSEKKSSLNFESTRPAVSSTKSIVENIEAVPPAPTKKLPLVNIKSVCPISGKSAQLTSTVGVKELDMTKSKSAIKAKSAVKMDASANKSIKQSEKHPEYVLSRLAFSKYFILGFVIFLFVVMVILVIVVWEILKSNPAESAIDFKTMVSSELHETTTVDSESPMTSERDPWSLSKICQDHVGKCYYSPHKYVTNCTHIVCHMVTISPVVNVSEFVNYKYFYGRLLFTPTNRPKTLEYVPDGTPCKTDNKNEVGLCENKICNYNDSESVTEFVMNRQPIHGGWEAWNGIQQQLCFSNTFAINGTNSPIYAQGLLKVWYRYTLRTSCKNIHNLTLRSKPCRYYQFRTCTNPVPSFGGDLCWNKNHDILSLEDWPLIFAKHSCPNCRELTPLTKPQCQSPPDDLLCKPNKFLFHDPTIGTDYDHCCVQGEEGRCILGTCVPYKFSDRRFETL